MKNRITFFVIASKTGIQRRFSINKNIICCIVILFLLLLGSGIIGAWKYRENVELKEKCLLLEAEKGQMEAVARTVKDVKSKEGAIRKLLGLENAGDPEQETP